MLQKIMSCCLMEECCALQICLSAAMTLVALPVMVKGTLGWLLPRQAVQWIARLAPRLACGAILVLSLSRVAALLLNYGAPLQVYRQLPEVGPLMLASIDMLCHSWSAAWVVHLSPALPHNARQMIGNRLSPVQ